MCEGVPLPAEANDSLPGCALAAAITSLIDLYGVAGFAAMSCGTLMISDTGAKSRSTS